MQKVINALKKMGVEAEDSPELRSQVAAYTHGQDPDSLTAPQAVQVAEAIAASLKNGGALTTAATVQPTAAKGGKLGKGRKNAPAEQFADAVKLSLTNSAEEIKGGIIAPIAEFADTYSTQSATDALDILRNIPADTLSKFVQMAQEEQAQPERFRSLTQAALAGLGIDLPSLQAD